MSDDDEGTFGDDDPDDRIDDPKEDSEHEGTDLVTGNEALLFGENKPVG